MAKQQQPLTVRVAPPPRGSKGETLVLTITGEMGINALIGPNGQHSGIGEDNAFDKALAERVNRPPAMVVVDLTGVSYMSSVGVGALLRLKKRVESIESTVRFVGTNELVTLMKYSHLEKVLKLHPTVEAAIAE